MSTVNEVVEQYAKAIPDVARIAKINHEVKNSHEAIDVIDNTLNRNFFKNKHHVDFDILKSLIHKGVFNEDLTSLYF